MTRFRRANPIRRPAASLLPAACALIAAISVAPHARGQILSKELPEDMQGVDVIEQRGAEVPLDLKFLNAQGNTVQLGDYFDGRRPVVLILGYYDCPLLCTLVFNRAQKAFNELGFVMGKDYRALAVSFDHTDTTSQAAAQQAAMLAGIRKVQGPPVQAWPFVTASARNARALADSVGYAYKFLPESGEFSHPAAIVILSPSGTVSNYLYGVEYPAKQLRLALLDAAEGKIGNVFDRVLLFCYHYDPTTGAWGVNAFRVMQVSAVATVILLGGFLAWLFVSTARKAKRMTPPAERVSSPSPNPTPPRAPAGARLASVATEA